MTHDTSIIYASRHQQSNAAYNTCSVVQVIKAYATSPTELPLLSTVYQKLVNTKGNFDVDARDTSSRLQFHI